MMICEYVVGNMGGIGRYNCWLHCAVGNARWQRKVTHILPTIQPTISKLVKTIMNIFHKERIISTH